MRKIAVCCLCAALSGAAVAVESASPRRSFTGRRFGGMVVRPGSMQGKIVVGNSQAKVPMSVVERAVDGFRRVFNPEIEVKTVEKPGVGSAAKAVESAGGQVALFIVDDAGLPTLLSAPESGWAMVNVAPLAEGADGPALAKRVRIEVVRGLALLSGACSSSYAETLMGAVRAPADLDKMDDAATLPVDVASRFMDYLKAWGVTQGLRVQYRQAVREGWAPAPTNDIQKAIWEQVKAEKDRKPSNPIKVNFDPKTAPKVGR